MRQPLLTLRGYVDVLLVDIAARRAGRTTTLALGALLAVALLLGAAAALRPAGDAALPAPAVSGAAPSAARVLPGQVEIGRREYLPGEGPAVATAARDGAGKLAYLPGEAPAGVGDVMVPLVGRQP